MEIELCWILLEDDRPLDARILGKEAAKVLGMPLMETKMLLRRGRGILVEDLPRETAEALVDLLKKENVPCRLVPAGDIPFLEPPHRVGEISADEGRISVRFPDSDEPVVLSWNDLEMVFGGAVALPGTGHLHTKVDFSHLPTFHRMEDDARELVRENLLLNLEGPSEVVEDNQIPFDPSGFDLTPLETLPEKWSKKARVVADATIRDSSQRLRIAIDEFVYTPKKDSVKLGQAWGFTAFLKDVQRFAPLALTPSLERLCENDLEPWIFSSMEEFQRIGFWEWILRRLDREEAPHPE